MPALISFNVLKGQQFDVYISINNLDNFDTLYSIKAGNEITSWVSFYNENQSVQINQLAVPALSSTRFIARFNIPKDAPNGQYSSSIYVETLSNEQNLSNASSLSIRVPISVLLDLQGLQYITGKILNITTSDTEVNRILRIKTEFKNTGDVIATPRIEVVILKNGAEIANFVQNNTSVNVNNTLVIDSDWDTTGQTVGDYVANVKAYLSDKLLEEKNLNFKILERGTLTAEGKIQEVKASSEVKTGQPAKVEVQFQNTGEIDLTAKITGEVYLNNNLVDTLNGDETLIKVGENETLTAYFRPSQEGNYSIQSSVTYEGKKEPLSDITISATGGSSSNVSMFDTQNLLLILFVVFAIVLIIVGIVYRKVKKPTKRK